MQGMIGTGGGVVATQRPGVRVMLLTDLPEGATAHRLAGLGSVLEVEEDFHTALAAMIDDPLGYDLFVMDCDGYGGIEAAERAIALLISAEARMRVMLLSAEFDVPAYPLGRRTAVCLPNSVPEEGFRRGFDHALRDRAFVTIM